MSNLLLTFENCQIAVVYFSSTFWAFSFASMPLDQFRFTVNDIYVEDLLTFHLIHFDLDFLYEDQR